MRIHRCELVHSVYVSTAVPLYRMTVFLRCEFCARQTARSDWTGFRAFCIYLSIYLSIYLYIYIYIYISRERQRAKYDLSQDLGPLDFQECFGRASLVQWPMCTDQGIQGVLTHIRGKPKGFRVEGNDSNLVATTPL